MWQIFNISYQPNDHAAYCKGLDKQKIECNFVNIFLTTSLNISFVCSKELSYCDGSFEYPKHMFWLRNKKNNF